MTNGCPSGTAFVSGTNSCKQPTSSSSDQAVEYVVNITFPFSQQISQAVLNNLREILATELDLPVSNVMVLPTSSMTTVVIQVIFTDTTKSMHDTVSEVNSAVSSGTVSQLFLVNDISYDPSSVSVTATAENGNEDVEPSSSATKLGQFGILFSVSMVATMMIM
jgi:hypothetical protein